MWARSWLGCNNNGNTRGTLYLAEKTFITPVNRMTLKKEEKIKD